MAYYYQQSFLTGTRNSAGRRHSLNGQFAKAARASATVITGLQIYSGKNVTTDGSAEKSNFFCTRGLVSSLVVYFKEVQSNWESGSPEPYADFHRTNPADTALIVQLVSINNDVVDGADSPSAHTDITIFLM
jgi:hypothetical protein